MKNKKIKQLTEAALLTSLVFVATKLVNIPTPVGGVINLVDAVILTISLLVSRRSAVLSSGIGSFLSELFSAYAIFAPATLIIKSLMAFTSNTLFNKLKDLITYLRGNRTLIDSLFKRIENNNSKFYFGEC